MFIFCVIFVCYCILVLLFLFKRKTAYDMRISDWSSDVCSSDLKRAERIDQERRDPRCSSRHCHRPNKRSAGRRTPCRQRPEHYSPELSEQRYTVRDRPRYHAVDQKI